MYHKQGPFTCTGVIVHSHIGTFTSERVLNTSFLSAELCLVGAFWDTVGEVVSVYQSELDLISCLCASTFHRLVYWVSLNACSSWRGFGSGLTIFPLLAMVALNLFLMYTLNLKEPLFGSQDVLYNQVTPSSWSGETSQSPSGKPDILPTDILDAQWGGELRFLLSEEEIFPKIGHSCGLQFSTATHAATITSKSVTA